MLSLSQHVNFFSISPVIIPTLMNGGKTAEEVLLLWVCI